MAKTPEGKVKAAVVKILKEEGVYYFFPATHGYGRSGVPDIVCCVDGRFLGIECKAGKNELTALQERERNRIFSAGGLVAVVDEHSIDLVKGMLKLIRDDDGQR